jgi:hypothetical protein
MVRARLFQDALFLFAFGTVAIVVALTMNWHNTRTGCWLNAAVIGMAEVPFIVFVLVPGYLPLWPGALGPILWIAAMILTGLGQVTVASTARHSLGVSAGSSRD